jgi:hypothetical protein
VDQVPNSGKSKVLPVSVSDAGLVFGLDGRAGPTIAADFGVLPEPEPPPEPELHAAASTASGTSAAAV